MRITPVDFRWQVATDLEGNCAICGSLGYFVSDLISGDEQDNLTERIASKKKQLAAEVARGLRLTADEIEASL